MLFIPSLIVFLPACISDNFVVGGLNDVLHPGAYDDYFDNYIICCTGNW